ncbi:MAG: hypothetical protein IJ241_00910, partial [Clostridia bacterium]|nr:hypothetical protein [Clostridia bacterium]
ALQVDPSGQSCRRSQEHGDKIWELPPLSAEDAQKNYISWPIPPLTTQQKIGGLTDMLNLAESLTGMFGAIKYYTNK